MTSESVLPTANQYLSTMDTAGHKADDHVQGTVKGESIEKRSAALLISSPEWSKRHFWKAHIDLLKQSWREPRLPKVKQGCC
jgi:hypothetical protein